jgi:3-deoxy-D-manno-octulosonic-acid transferase
MFLALLYEFALWLLGLAALPRLLYQNIVQKKYRLSLSQKFGLGWRGIERKKKLIWIHAVSVGETKAIAALAKRLKNSDTTLLVTSVTETGHAEAKRSLPFADHHLFLPLDFSWIIKRIVRNLRPDLVLISETDFWYNFLKTAKQSGAVIAVVNAKISERSLRRFSQFSFFSKPLFALIDLFCVQNTLYKERFQALGILTEKLVVTGNLKFDETYVYLQESEKEALRNKFNLDPQDRVLVVASTHDPEEKILIKALKELWKKDANLKVILAPRHPERFSSVANLIENEGIPFVRYSQLPDPAKKAQMVLLDAMGLVRQCFQIADLAMVGGSFTSKVGGHNILEPCMYGVPVLFGPYMHTQLELRDLVCNYEAGFQLEKEDLAQKIDELSSNPALKEKCVEASKKLIIDCQGSVKRTEEALQNVLVN